MPPKDVEKDESGIGIMCNDVFGNIWMDLRIAHMSTGDKIGVELFEFPENEDKHNNFKYWKTGLFHFSVQYPNIEKLVDTIIKHGGKKRMSIREYYPGEKPYRMCYIQDPFGNVFEIYSHSYELTYSYGAY